MRGALAAGGDARRQAHSKRDDDGAAGCSGLLAAQEQRLTVAWSRVGDYTNRMPLGQR